MAKLNGSLKSRPSPLKRQSMNGPRTGEAGPLWDAALRAAICTDVAFNGKASSQKRLRQEEKSRECSKKRKLAAAENKATQREEKRASDCLRYYYVATFRTSKELEEATQGQGSLAAKRKFLTEQVRARTDGWGLEYEGDISTSLYSKDSAEVAIQKLTCTVTEMMKLEQSRDEAVRRKYSRPPCPPCQQAAYNTDKLPALGPQVPRRSSHQQQDRARLAGVVEKMDQDDPECATFTRELVGMHFWDKDERHKRYQVVSIAWCSQHGRWQAECVRLGADGNVEAKHKKLPAPLTYSALIPYMLGEGWLSVQDMKQMAEMYETKMN